MNAFGFGAALEELSVEDLLRVASSMSAFNVHSSTHRTTVAQALIFRLPQLPVDPVDDDDRIGRQVVAMLRALVVAPVPSSVLRAALGVIRADVSRGLLLIPLLPEWLDRRSAVTETRASVQDVVAALADAVAADRRALLPALAALADIDADVDESVMDRREFDLLALSQSALAVVDESDVPVVVRAMIRSAALRRASPLAARDSFNQLRAATMDLGDSSFRLCTESLASELALPRSAALLDHFLASVRAAAILSSLDCAVMLWLLHAFDASFAARGAEQWLAIRSLLVDAMLARRLPIDVLLAACRNQELLLGRVNAVFGVVVALLEPHDWLCEQSASQLCATSLDVYDSAHECVVHLLECMADERRDVAARAARLLLEQARARPLRLVRSAARLEEALLQVTRPDAAVFTALVGALAAIHSSSSSSSSSMLMVFVQKHLFSASTDHVCVGAHAARALLGAAPAADDRDALLGWVVRALHQTEFRGAGADALLRACASVSQHFDEQQQRSVFFHASLMPFVMQTNLVRGAPRPPLFGGNEQVADDYIQLMAFVELRWQDQLRADSGSSDSAAAPVSALLRCLVQFYVDMYDVQCYSRVWRAFGGARMTVPDTFSLELSQNARLDASLLLRECRCIVYALDVYCELLDSVWGREFVCRDDSHQHGDELLQCVRSLLLWRGRAVLYIARLSSSTVSAVALAASDLPRSLARADASLTSVRSVRALSRGLLALLTADNAIGDDGEFLLDTLRILHASVRAGPSAGTDESTSAEHDDVWFRVAGFAALCPELLQYLVVGCNRFVDRIADLRSDPASIDERALDRALSSCALCLSLLDRAFVSIVAATDSDDAISQLPQVVRVREGRASSFSALTRSLGVSGAPVREDYDAQHRALFGFLTALFGRVPERFLALICLRTLSTLTSGLEASCLVAQHYHAALALVYPLERVVVLQTLVSGDADQVFGMELPGVGDSSRSLVRFKTTSLLSCRQAFVSYCLHAVFRLLPAHRLQACETGGASSGFGSALQMYAEAVHSVATSIADAATREKATPSSKKRARKTAATPTAGSVEHSTIRQLNSTTVWSFCDTISVLAVSVLTQFDASKVVVLRDDDDDDDDDENVLNPFASLIQALNALSLLHDLFASRIGQSVKRDRGALTRLCRLVPLVVRKMRSCVQWRATCGSPRQRLDVSRASLVVLVRNVRTLVSASRALLQAAKASKKKTVLTLVPRAVAQLEQLSSECDRCVAAEHLETLGGDDDGPDVGQLAPGGWAGVVSNVCDALVRDAQMQYIFAGADENDAGVDDGTLGGSLQPDDAARFRVFDRKYDDEDVADDDNLSDEDAPMVVTFRDGR